MIGEREKLAQAVPGWGFGVFLALVPPQSSKVTKTCKRRRNFSRKGGAKYEHTSWRRAPSASRSPGSSGPAAAASSARHEQPAFDFCSEKPRTSNRRISPDHDRQGASRR